MCAPLGRVGSPTPRTASPASESAAPANRHPHTAPTTRAYRRRVATASRSEPGPYRAPRPPTARQQVNRGLRQLRLRIAHDSTHPVPLHYLISAQKGPPARPPPPHPTSPGPYWLQQLPASLDPEHGHPASGLWCLHSPAGRLPKWRQPQLRQLRGWALGRPAWPGAGGDPCRGLPSLR